MESRCKECSKDLTPEEFLFNDKFLEESSKNADSPNFTFPLCLKCHFEIYIKPKSRGIIQNYKTAGN